MKNSNTSFAAISQAQMGAMLAVSATNNEKIADGLFDGLATVSDKAQAFKPFFVDLASTVNVETHLIAPTFMTADFEQGELASFVLKNTKQSILEIYKTDESDNDLKGALQNLIELMKSRSGKVDEQMTTDVFFGDDFVFDDNVDVWDTACTIMQETQDIFIIMMDDWQPKEDDSAVGIKGYFDFISASLPWYVEGYMDYGKYLKDIRIERIADIAEFFVPLAYLVGLPTFLSLKSDAADIQDIDGMMAQAKKLLDGQLDNNVLKNMAVIYKSHEYLVLNIIDNIFDEADFNPIEKLGGGDDDSAQRYWEVVAAVMISILLAER